MNSNSGRGFFIIVITALIMIFFIPAHVQARENFRGMITTQVSSMTVEEIKNSKETCIECHSKTTPRIVEEHRKSGHTAAGVSCVDCHGSDHEKMPLVTGKKVCAKCHQQETEQMLNSKHAYKNTQVTVEELRNLKTDLVERDIFEEESFILSPRFLKKASPEDQETIRQLASDLTGCIKEGEASYVKIKIGAAHVNPDYTHWYGNSYLNLNLSKAQGTARELQLLADKAGYAGVASTTTEEVIFLLGSLFAGFSAFFFFLKYVNRKKDRE